MGFNSAFKGLNVTISLTSVTKKALWACVWNFRNEISMRVDVNICATEVPGLRRTDGLASEP